MGEGNNVPFFLPRRGPHRDTPFPKFPPHFPLQSPPLLSERPRETTLLGSSQESTGGPRGSLPAPPHTAPGGLSRPSPGSGGGEASPARLPSSVSGVLLRKIYVPLRFGNRSHTKKKEEREKEMILIFFGSRNEAEVSKF